ncbi:MAG: LamG domain-containing protein, partial [Calditerrivibrio sp.]|nr:LamG domain-containing protein [Calditerrivibrio sp.]
KGNAGEVKDFSINNIHGTSKTANPIGEIAQTDSTAVVGRGLLLKGEGYNAPPNNQWYEADSYIEFPDNNLLSAIGKDGMTITGWFQVDSLNNQEMTILHKGQGNNTQEYRVFVSSNKILKAYVYDQWGGQFEVSATKELVAGAWYFFSLVAYKNGNKMVLKIYTIKAGSNETDSGVSIKANFVYTLPSNTVGNLYVGATNWGSGSITNFFKGRVDELNLFYGPLSVTDIVKIRNNEVIGKNWDGTNRDLIVCPLAEYRFEMCDLSNTAKAIDETGNYNAKVVQGAHVDIGSNYGNNFSCNILNLRNAGSDYDRHIEITANPIPLSGDWTLMTWINFPINFDKHIKFGSYRYAVIAGGTQDLGGFRLHDNGNMQWYASSSALYFNTFPNNLVGWHHIALVGQGSKTKMYLDGQYLNEVNYKQTGYFNRILSTNDRGYVDTNRRQNIDAEVDEFKFFSSPLTGQNILSIYNNEKAGKLWDGSIRSCLPCGGLSLYLIEHDGVGLTCQPENITIKACVDVNCNQLSTTSTSVTLNKNNINIGNYSFIGSTSGSVSQQIPSTVRLSLTNLNPNSIYGFKCNNLSDSIASDNQSQCDITFYDSGFVFDIINDYACKEQTVNIYAVRKDDFSYRCVPAFQNKTLPVDFTFNYVNPSANTSGTKPKINNNDLNATVNLSFDNNGQSSFSFKYPDAGQISITATYDNTTSNTKSVGSDTSVFRPYGFYVYTTSPEWQADSGANSSQFKKAGEVFNLSARAVCWESNVDPDLSDNLITQNYDNRTVQISHQLIEPIGGDNGLMGVNSIIFNNGVASIDNQTFSEVGIIRFTLQDNYYLGTSDNISGTSANIGRFYPAYFGNPIKGSVVNAINNFTYFGQDNVTINSFKFSALNLQGNLTKNYRDNYIKINSENENSYYFSNSEGLPFTATINSSLWTNGTLEASAKFIFTRNAPINPKFPIVMIKPTDSDGVTSPDNMSINDNNSIELRYGLFDIKDNYGTVNLPLTLNGYLLYLDNRSKWSLNIDDNVTNISSLNIVLSEYSGNLSSGETSILEVKRLINGEYRIILSPPGLSNDGSVKLKLSGFNFLYDDIDTPGIATFGIYNQKNKRLYWKEVPSK